MSNRPKRTPQRPSRVRQQQRETARRRGITTAIVGGLIVVAVVLIAVIVASTGDDSDTADDSDIALNGVPLVPYTGGADDAALGQKAPIFVTEDTTGTRVVTGGGGGPNDTAKVIVFMAHWCPTCQAELPRLVDWLDTNELPEGVEIVVVSTFENPGRDNYPASAWFAAEGLPMPALLDSSSGTIASAYGFSSVPSWTVIDDQNFVLTRTTGGLDDAAFEALVALASTGV